MEVQIFLVYFGAEFFFAADIAGTSIKLIIITMHIKVDLQIMQCAPGVCALRALVYLILITGPA